MAAKAADRSKDAAEVVAKPAVPVAAPASKASPDEVTADTVVESPVIPCRSKAAEVYAMEAKTRKKFPLLKYRFEHGRAPGHCDPMQSLGLILEVVDFMMTPIQAHMEVTPPGKPVCVLAGTTGAGKSLAGNWILGKKVKKNITEIPAEDSDDEPDKRIDIEVEAPVLSVGEENFKSQTFAPNVIPHEWFTLIDYPGLCDTGGFEIRIGMDLAFRELLDLVKPVHVLCLVPIQSFLVAKGDATKRELDKLRKLMPFAGCQLGASKAAPSEESCRWMIGITKCDADFVRGAKDLYAEAERFIANWSPQFPMENVVNMNKLIFSNKGDAKRTDFVSKLQSSTYTPCKDMTTLEDELKRAFGDRATVRSIASDCLSMDDVAKLVQVLKDDKLEQFFVKSSAPSFTCDEANLSKFKDSWQVALNALRDELGKVKKSVKEIRHQTDQLVKTRRLSLERQNDMIGRLCGETGQPRMKLAFVKTEETISMRNTASAVELFEALSDLATELHKHGCVTRAHHKEVIARHEEVKKEIKNAVRELGYKDTEDFLSNKRVWAGGATVVGGGILVGTVSCSTTIGGWWAGAGALSGKALVGLSLGGVAAVGGVICLAVSYGWSAYDDSWSVEFKKMLINAFDELLATLKALIDHKKCLGAITENLQSLELL